MAWFTLILEGIRNYFAQDALISYKLIVSLIYLILIDTFFGVWKHYKNKSLSSSGWGSFATKIIIYWGFYIVARNIAGIPFLDWSGDLLISGLLIRESISIVENMEKMKPGTIPPWITKRLKDFDDNGNFIQPAPNPRKEGGV